jgi:hypothetical protein
LAACLAVANWCLLSTAAAQSVLVEDFNAVTGTGGQDLLIGAGFNEVDGWDDGISGEGAFAGTWGDGDIGTSSVMGLTNGGINGTGAGLIMVDNATYDVGGWFGAMIWRDLTLPTLDPSRINMRAMVRGDVFNAGYLIRLEALKLVPYGLDESFVDATGTGGGIFLAPGGVNGFTPGWDDGIAGEAAFAGVFGSAQVFGSVSANAVIGGGFEGNGGQIVVDAISFGPGSGWYAGLLWGNQQLASPVLEEIELRARVRGTAQAGLGEMLGKYVLRIEDGNQDWRAFPATSTGNFQQVGGFLSDGIEGGFGDGVFDPENGPFNIVLVFDNDAGNTWGFGGTLTIDDLFMTGGVNTAVAGTVTYDSVTSSTTLYESVGGRLDNGVSTFDNIDDDFSSANGVGGGVFFDNTSGATGFTEGYDDGLTGEAAFAGFWGSVSVGTTSADVTFNGGVNGSKAVELTATGMTVNGTGGWWSGLMWRDQVLPDGPLEDIYLTADIKGLQIPGGSLGQYHLRIEDAQNDFLGFVVDATGGFQTVGGPLSEATEGTFIGDGTFHRDSGPFTVVVAFYEENATWGTGGTLTVDNLFLSPADFGAGAETYAAVVAFRDEVEDWGSGGALEVDDLAVVVINADHDGDEDVDLADFSAVQNCFSGSFDEYDTNDCLPIDFDGDFDLDDSDVASFLVEFQGPQ